MELKVVYRRWDYKLGAVIHNWVGNTLQQFIQKMDAKEVDYEIVDAYPVTDSEAESIRWENSPEKHNGN